MPSVDISLPASTADKPTAWLFLLARPDAGAALYPYWLGADPAEYITRSTGDRTLRFLLLALAVTTLRSWLI